MKIKVLLIISALFCTFWGLGSCEKLETYSEIPSVEFLKVYIADTVDALDNDIKYQQLFLEVIDGDGDLGLENSDTSGVYSPDSLYYNNLFITVYRKLTDGSYVELDNTINNNLRYRIPYKEPAGQNKYLKAEIKVKMEPALSKFDYDTIRYEFWVVDRKFNKSEIAQSCDIPLKLTVSRTSGDTIVAVHGTVYADETMELVDTVDVD